MYSHTCDNCRATFVGAAHGRTCSDACRAAVYRRRLQDQRARLAAEAHAAAESGDLAALTRVARATAALLAA